MSALLEKDARAGLVAAMAEPVRSAYVEAIGTWTPSEGLGARLEAGWHPTQPLSVYAATALNRGGLGAEVGARWEF